jgi:hypothetical protein
MRADADGLDPRLGLRALEIEVQQPVVEPGALHLHPFRQHEGALELPRGDAAMQEDAPLGIVLLAAADHQLVVLLRDLQVVHGEAGDGQRDAQAVIAGLLDIVGRVAIGALAHAVEHLLEVVEAEEQGRTEKRLT